MSVRPIGPDGHSTEHAATLLTRARELSQRVAKFGNKLSTETETLSDETKRLFKVVNDALEQASRDLEDWQGEEQSGSLSGAVEEVVQLENALSILHGHGPGGDLRKFLQLKKPKLLGWFHGSANFISYRKDQSNKLKEEYHCFRNHCAYIMFGFALLLHLGVLRSQKALEANEQLTLLPVVMVGVQLFLCWLLYFYTATALRESVLKVNGSLIRPWWIQHHYWSMAACVLMLSLPADSPAFVQAATRFLWWAMMQAIVIVLQNRYQRRRMYTRIALGKNSCMDVISGESSGSFGQLYILYPLLFWMQALQFYIGVDMYASTSWSLSSLEGFLDPERPGSDLWGSRGVAVAGAMMMFMAVKNFQNTIATIIGKRRSRKQSRNRISMLRSSS